MGVLTVFYRVSSKEYDRLLEDLDGLEAIRDGEVDEPPSLNVEKMWHETMLLLGAAGYADIREILDAAIEEELETENGVEVQAFDVDAVKKLASMLAAIPLDGVAKAAIETEDSDIFRDKPWVAESAAKFLASVAEFFGQAAAEREAVFITTS